MGLILDYHFKRILQSVKEKHATSLKLLPQNKAIPIVTNMNSLDTVLTSEILPSNNVVCSSIDGMPGIVNNNKNFNYNFSKIKFKYI